ALSRTLGLAWRQVPPSRGSRQWNTATEVRPSHARRVRVSATLFQALRGLWTLCSSYRCALCLDVLRATRLRLRRLACRYSLLSSCCQSLSGPWPPSEESMQGVRPCLRDMYRAGQTPKLLSAVFRRDPGPTLILAAQGIDEHVIQTSFKIRPI